MLARFMSEKETTSPGFLSNARLTALEALEDPDPVIALTGIQVLTVVGTQDDIEQIRGLLSHPDTRVTTARCALFERGVRA
jgi:hypothetical protein